MQKPLQSLLFTLKSTTNPHKQMWDSADAQQREIMLRRANIPFEDYLRSEVGREYTSNGKKLKLGQLPHQDVQMLSGLWKASVEHANKLGIKLPPEVIDSYHELRRGKNSDSHRAIVVDAYANHIADLVRTAGGVVKKKKKQ